MSIHWTQESSNYMNHRDTEDTEKYLCVLRVSVVDIPQQKTNHGDTDNTELHREEDFSWQSQFKL